MSWSLRTNGGAEPWRDCLLYTSFSEQFNISKEVLEITGVFDVILDIDTRVFIDPALLELCTEPEFLDAQTGAYPNKMCIRDSCFGRAKEG